MLVRVATPDDVEAMSDTLARAFASDPVWAIALSRPDGDTSHVAAYWRYFVHSSVGFGTTYVGVGPRTVSVWVPPGESELTDADADAVFALMRDRLEPSSYDAFATLWDRFEQARPHDEPHAYLTLLATNPDDAGHGYGMAHLEATLAHWDAEGVPTYLESSNPANDARYERRGYRRIGEFETVLNRSLVGTYWRPVGG